MYLFASGYIKYITYTDIEPDILSDLHFNKSKNVKMLTSLVFTQ